MGVRFIFLLVVLGPLALRGGGGAPEPQAASGATASGIFTGRSGKPMAKARLFLGQIEGDQEVTWAKIKLRATIPAATCDDQGRFQVKGFTPGDYTILYQPAGATAVAPLEINIKPLLGVIRSIVPELPGFEVGKNEPYPDRIWGRTFTLLKGHTFRSEGANMKIWNATVRGNPQGPYLEVRRGLVWLHRLDNNSQIKVDAWSH
ncbi:MAG: hypothetical protein ACRD96_03745 [Bryobacteraceae bacterium]